MKIAKTASVFLVALTLIAIFIPDVMAQMGNAESITVTIDRKTYPNIIFHPRLWKSQPETVTLHDFVIRDYYGIPIDAFIVQTASGRTEIPIEQVAQICTKGWITRASKDIDLADSVIKADIVLTDGTQMESLMNLDFGTIEGKSELGDFYLNDPHTVRQLVFNRGEQAVEAPLGAAPAVTEAAPARVAPAAGPDSDGDGVPDSADKCPDTLKGAPVDSAGCWALKGITFDYEKWNIKPEFYPVLDEDVRVLEMNPGVKIEAQGHTDNIATERFNQKLSEKRAKSVKDYFVSKGISADRISTRGFGELCPITCNDSPEGRAQNRRVEIKAVGQ